MSVFALFLTVQTVNYGIDISLYSLVTVSKHSKTTKAMFKIQTSLIQYKCNLKFIFWINNYPPPHVVNLFISLVIHLLLWLNTVLAMVNLYSIFWHNPDHTFGSHKVIVFSLSTTSKRLLRPLKGVELYIKSNIINCYKNIEISYLFKTRCILL